MAIGSDPEIGVVFARWGGMDDESRTAWFRYMQERWGSDLMGGYAKVCHPDPERFPYLDEVTWTLV